MVMVARLSRRVGLIVDEPLLALARLDRRLVELVQSYIVILVMMQCLERGAFGA